MSTTENNYDASCQLQVAIAAHDLRNRLSVARCQVFQLRCQIRTSPCDARVRSSLASVTRALLRTNTLLEDVLELTAVQVRLPATTTPAVDIIRVARRLVAREPYTGRDHDTKVVTRLPHLIGAWDVHRLTIVLRILLDNAVAYSPKGGCVTVEIESDDGCAVVNVRDHGAGISAEDLPHVFEPFYRGHDVATRTAGLGLGLGLPTARLIVEQYAGVLDVESTEGAGSCFTIRLPLLAT
jgi:signal transduction histidine kinase